MLSSNCNRCGDMTLDPGYDLCDACHEEEMEYDDDGREERDE